MERAHSGWWRSAQEAKPGIAGVVGVGPLPAGQGCAAGQLCLAQPVVCSLQQVGHWESGVMSGASKLPAIFEGRLATGPLFVLS